MTVPGRRPGRRGRPAGSGGVAALSSDGARLRCTSPPRSDNRIVRFELDGRGTATPIRRRHREAAPTTTAARWRSGPTGSCTPASARPASRRLAQDRASLNGKILRIDPVGDARPGQPVPGSLRLVAGAPQRAGAGVGRPGPAVGHRVRAGQLRRGQPDPARRATTAGRRSRAWATPTAAGSPIRR